MGSSFEELVARDSTVETDRNSDTRIKSYDFFKKVLLKLNTRACEINHFP